MELIEQLNIVENSANITNIDPQSLMVDIEGMHSNIVTGNYTSYTPEALLGSIPSWTQPYKKPVIMHHNEKDGKIIGRIINVSSKESDTRSGTPALLFTVNIPDEDGKKQTQDGRLATVSVGISASDVRCSICGANVAECQCEHKRGEKYNGNVCYWEIRSFKGKELSYVITPSDPYAHIIKVYSPNNDEKSLKEQEDMDNENATIQLEEQKMLNNENADSNNDIENNVKNTDISKSNQTEEKNNIDNASSVETASAESTTNEQSISEESAVNVNDTAQVQNTDTNSLLIDELIKRLNEKTCECKEMECELKWCRNDAESLRHQLSALELKYKMLLAAKFNECRTNNGQPIIEAEELSKRTIESIEDSINDMTIAINESKEENNIINNESENKVDDLNIIEGLQQVESPVNIINDNINNDCTKTENVVDMKETFNSLITKLYNY